MSSFDQVTQQCRHLKLASLAQDLPELLQRAEANEMSYLQYTEVLLEHEIEQRNSKRITMNRRKADFPIEKHLEAFDYRHQTTINKRQVNQLLDFDFIDNRSNLIFIGPPGVGKTHLSIGIGSKAIDAGYKVLLSEDDKKIYFCTRKNFRLNAEACSINSLLTDLPTKTYKSWPTSPLK